MTGFMTRPGLASSVALAVAAAVGCQLDDPHEKPTAHPAAGLYTPGNRLGASDPTDTPSPGMGLGDRCVALGFDPDSIVATPGELTLEYTTRSLDGRYAPKNCTAAWIETEDGRYVATIEVRAALRRPGLWYWQDHACTDKTGPDVMTSATLADHERPHAALWKGLDFEGMPVPDGNYVLYVEVTESDKEPGEFASWMFVKGPAATGGPMPVDFEGPLVSASAVWAPEAEGSAGAGGM